MVMVDASECIGASEEVLSEPITIPSSISTVGDNKDGDDGTRSSADSGAGFVSDPSISAVAAAAAAVRVTEVSGGLDPTCTSASATGTLTTGAKVKVLSLS